MLSARSKLATNTGLISGSAVLCDPGITRHYATLGTSKMAADVHLPALAVIIRHYVTLGTANF
jgi:hypothetical protein